MLEHERFSRKCWCNPRLAKPCDECDGDPGCWKCEDGLIDTTIDDPDDILIIHVDDVVDIVVKELR